MSGIGMLPEKPQSSSRTTLVLWRGYVSVSNASFALEASIRPKGLAVVWKAGVVLR